MLNPLEVSAEGASYHRPSFGPGRSPGPFRPFIFHLFRRSVRLMKNTAAARLPWEASHAIKWMRLASLVKRVAAFGRGGAEATPFLSCACIKPA